MDTPSGAFGHIRIFTFSVDDADPFVAEFARLAAALPQDGLIVDVRGNGGGLIYAAERLLQVLTPRHVEPEPAQMTTTPLMLGLCERHDPSPLDPTFDLSPWVASLRQAVSTGAQYSNAFAITDEGSANAVGQRYHGPVVLVTDALCYSATDIFSAGFQDHGIGPVLGVDGNTGAGGANVWTHDLLKLLMDTAPDDGGPAANPFVDLPAGAGFRVSVRRTLRVGADRVGTPVEDFGVVPDEVHELTRADIVGDNPDLLARAGELLAGRPAYTLALADPPEVRPDGKVRMRLTTAGLDRVDVAFDGRPVASLDVAGGTLTRTLAPAAPSPSDPRPDRLVGRRDRRPPEGGAVRLPCSVGLGQRGLRLVLRGDLRRVVEVDRQRPVDPERGVERVDRGARHPRDPLVVEAVDVLGRLGADDLEGVAHAAGHQHLGALGEAYGHDRAVGGRVAAGVDVGAEGLAGHDGDQLVHVLCVQAPQRAGLRLGHVDLQPRAERRHAGVEEGRLAVELAHRSPFVGHLLHGDEPEALDGGALRGEVSDLGHAGR